MPPPKPPRPDRVTGPVWGLDLGQRTGWAVSRPGEKPKSGTWVLKGPRDPQSRAFGEIMRVLQDAWKVERPELVVAEAPLTLAAFIKLRNSEDNVQMHFGLRGVIQGMCDRWNVEFIASHNATCRLHFIGAGRMGERQLTKNAVVRRCQVLGLVPTTCFDEDRCDALAVQDWAAYTHGQRCASIKELHLFGERPK